VTRIRLGWETQLDQLTLAIDLALLGVGLILAGALVHWHGWLAQTFGILLIVVGAIFCLVDGLRLLGWRSLLWPRSLLLDETGISDDSKKGRGFRFDWTDLEAVGVIEDRLVFFPQQRSYDLARREGVVEAVLNSKPADWQQQRSSGWSALITAPGAPVPTPPPAPRQQRIDVATAIAWQALIGGALAAFFGVSAYLAAFGVIGSTGSRTAFLAIGTPFALIGLATLLSIPVAVRRRWVVIDQETFTWADPTETSFTVGWKELTGVSLDLVTVPSATLSRHSVHVYLTPADAAFAQRHPEMRLFAKDGRYVLELGDVPGPARAIAAACQDAAPSGIWQGIAERTGTLGIK